jgi:hypothetical protein
MHAVGVLSMDGAELYKYIKIKYKIIIIKNVILVNFLHSLKILYLIINIELL